MTERKYRRVDRWRTQDRLGSGPGVGPGRSDRSRPRRTGTSPATSCRASSGNRPSTGDRHHWAVPTAERAVDRGTARATRHALEIGAEFRERRTQLGLSQAHVARACQLSRTRYGVIERGRSTTTTLGEAHRVAAVLGLDIPLRLYPAGPPVRDAAHADRLQSFLAGIRAPLSYRVEVPLPARAELAERRAWDAMLFGGGGKRTAVELEMRLRDVQAVRRRHELKRRDDPTEGFLLLIADTRTNRRVIAEFAQLFGDLPRLRPGVVRARLAGGEHPPTGMLLV